MTWDDWKLQTEQQNAFMFQNFSNAYFDQEKGK